jgi:hypothetical protein
MSLQDLQVVLQEQLGRNGLITVSAATLSSAKLTASPDFDKTIESYLCLKGALTVAVSGSIAPPSGNTLNVLGKASFLGLTGADVQVTFTLETNNTVDALIKANLPAHWNFSTSFPLLVGFPFSQLSIVQPSYLLTTSPLAAYEWHGESIALLKGLNFASFLEMAGPLGILQGLISSLAPGTKVVFTGAVDPTQIDPLLGTPVLSLTGTIDGPITGKIHFPLSLPSVHVRSYADENGSQSYWLVFSSTLSVREKPFSTFEAAILNGSPELTFSMIPTNTAITPEEIIDLIGGVDFLKAAPEPLHDLFKSVGLRGLGAQVNVMTPEVISLSGSIGTAKPWNMGEFKVKDLVLECSVLSPFSKLQMVLVNVRASAEIFPEVFKGDFDLVITTTIGTSDLSIGANFDGQIYLKDLVWGLSNKTIQLPSNFDSIEFDDIGMSFTKSQDEYDYTLYGSAKGTFEIKLLESPVVATFELNVDSATKTYLLIGGLTLGNSFFQAKVNLSGDKQVLTGSWKALNKDYLNFQDILTALKLDVPAIPSDLDLALEEASITYDITDKAFVITAKSVNYGAAVFVSMPVDEVQEYFFLVGVKPTFSLSNLPLVGKELAAIENIEVGKIEVIIASNKLSPDTASKINDLITSIVPNGYPLMPKDRTTGKLMLSAEIDFGTHQLPLNLSMGGASAAGNVEALAPANSMVLGGPVRTSGSPDGVSWYDVQKSFGPVTIQRIGAMFQSEQQTLWFEIEGTLALGPLTLSLVGLGMGSPIKDFKPQFSLQGLGISYSEAPLEIAGAFVNLAPPGAKYIEFEGGVTVGTGSFTLEAFGYYGSKSGFPSMFIFGDLAYDFGGPPAFFVTGVALGFGYNSSLRIPTIDQVQSFPFVEVLPTSTVPSTGVFPSDQPLAVLDVIMNTQPPWVSPSAGSLWFAAGITFTSFELVNSQALVIVEVGSGLVIALIGTSRAQFPQPAGVSNEPVYAYIELDLEVRFAPSEGVFSVQAVLAKSSFLLDKACVLTGGFAFFVWFGSNPHAGDFVLTLGGYNPGFTPPSYYPSVPEVGFHWSLDSSINISGGAYFALTPSVLMVGGELNATYQSGNLKAWFDAHADVIIQWKPFWFDAGIGITIGASYKLDLLFTTATISVELGCDLEIWGPPTGGAVTVDWYIIKFTIPFGTPKPTTLPKIQGWKDVQAMLPNTGTEAAPNVLTLAPSAGISPASTSPSAKKKAQATDNSPAHWIVRGSQFGFSTSSSIPATSATVGSSYAFNGSKFNVAPLSWSGVSATHVITITDSKNEDVSSKFAAVQVQKSLPSSLWGSPPAKTPAGDGQLVPDQIVGVTLQVNPPQIGSSAGPVHVELRLGATPLNLPGATMPISGSAKPSGDVPVNSQGTISKITNEKNGIASENVIGTRNTIFAALKKAGYAPTTANDPMTRFANEIGCALSAEPLLVS